MTHDSTTMVIQAGLRKSPLILGFWFLILITLLLLALAKVLGSDGSEAPGLQAKVPWSDRSAEPPGTSLKQLSTLLSLDSTT